MMIAVPQHETCVRTTSRDRKIQCLRIVTSRSLHGAGPEVDMANANPRRCLPSSPRIRCGAPDFAFIRHGIRTMRQRQKGPVITAKQNHCGFALYQFQSDDVLVEPADPLELSHA